MIKGIGIDLVELERIKRVWERQPRLPQRLLTDEELDLFHTLSEGRQAEFLAGRFAAKEALAKALGTGVGKSFSWRDVSVLKGEKGAPLVVWHKRPAPVGESDVIHLSLSHSRLYAVAYAVVERKGES